MARKQTSENPGVLSTGAAPAASRRKPVTKRTRTVAAEVSVAPTTAVGVDQQTAEVMQRAAEIMQPIAIVAPTFTEVAALAYSYWEARGRQGGSPEADWLRAEQELCATPAR